MTPKNNFVLLGGPENCCGFMQVTMGDKEEPLTAPNCHRACESAALSDGMNAIDIDRRKVVVARIQDQLFAFAGLCPHVAGPMHRGELNGCIVTCPLHGWRFDLAKGGCKIHGQRTLDMFQVKEEGGSIFVSL